MTEAVAQWTKKFCRVKEICRICLSISEKLKEPEKIKRPPETRLKECRLCIHPGLISNPALEPLL